MKLPRLLGRREGPQVTVARYARSGRLTRRTARLYPPAPVPANCRDLMPTTFELLDQEMDAYLAGLARRRAEFDVGHQGAA